MTTTLAQALADRLAGAFPYLDRVVGLARLSTTTGGDTENPVTLKLPVPVFFTGEDCQLNPRYLVPDIGTPGLMFFEDGGSQPTGQPSLGLRTATLNLLAWFNLPLLDPQPTEVQLLALIERALGVGTRWSTPELQDISVRPRVLPAEASLFGRYTFADTTLTPLLLPPYLVLGLALTVEFRVNLKCLNAPTPAVLNRPSCN